MLITEVRKAVEEYQWHGADDASVRRWVEGTPWTTLKAEIAEPSERALALWDAAPELFGMLEAFAAVDGYLTEEAESDWLFVAVCAVVGFVALALIVFAPALFG